MLIYLYMVKSATPVGVREVQSNLDFSTPNHLKKPESITITKALCYWLVRKPDGTTTFWPRLNCELST